LWSGGGKAGAAVACFGSAGRAGEGVKGDVEGLVRLAGFAVGVVGEADLVGDFDEVGFGVAAGDALGAAGDVEGVGIVVGRAKAWLEGDALAAVPGGDGAEAAAGCGTES